MRLRFTAAAFLLGPWLLGPWIAFLLAAVLLAPSVCAQGLETNLVIGGIETSCKDFRGVTVRTTKMDELGDVARAWIVSRMPIITIDPGRMSKLPEKVQLFFYFHECGHHAMAHIFVPTITSENEADCWSVKKGRKMGLFTREDVVAFAPVFAHSHGSAAGHLPGPERVNHLLACFDDPSETAPSEEPAQAGAGQKLRSSAGGG